MKALSLRQPWAWAIARAGKRLENRTWVSLRGGIKSVPVAGQHIAIHASKTQPMLEDELGCLAASGVGALPAEAQVYGAIVAVAKVVDVLRCVASVASEREDGGEVWPRHEIDMGDWIRFESTWPRGPTDAADQVKRWWLGPYALVLDEVYAFEPITEYQGGAVKGALGFWNVPTDLEHLVLDAWQKAVASEMNATVRMMMPLRPSDIKRLIERELAQPCPECGAATQKEVIPGRDLDIVCSKACGWRFPIDTGPFSLGRRVD